MSTIDQKIFKYFKGNRYQFAQWLSNHQDRREEVDRSIVFIHENDDSENGTIYTRGDYYNIEQTNMSLVDGHYICITEQSGNRKKIDIRSDMILNIQELYEAGYNDKIVTKETLADYVKYCLSFDVIESQNNEQIVNG